MPRVLEYGLSERIDRFALHPVLGVPLFFLALFLLFQAVYTLGTPLQDGVAWLLEQFRELGLVHLQAILPGWLYGLLVEGVYDGGHGRFVRAGNRAVLSGHGTGRRQWLPVAHRLSDGCVDGASRSGRAWLRDAVDGFGCNVPALMGTG